MPDIVYDYQHIPTIRDFSRDDSFIRGLMGPFGSGKSSGCVIEILRRSQTQDPSKDGIRRTRWAVIRNTYPQLKDTTIKTFHQWLPPDKFGKYTPSNHDYLITAFPGVEIEIMYRALDRPEHVANLLSLELTGAWVNEAREIPWTIVKALRGRVGRYPAQRDGGPSWYGIIMDTNPPDDESWWYKLFEENRPDNVAIYKQPSGRSEQAENIPNLPKGYYDHLCSDGDEEFIKVYVDGEYGYVREGKPVYPEYLDSTHCKPCQPIKGKPIIRGWDFGLTPACVFTQVLPGGQWIIFDEMTSESMGADRFSDDVLEYCSKEYPKYQFEDYGDPAGNQKAQTDEKTCFEVLKGKGIQIQPGEQTVELRISSVKKPLRSLVDGKPRLIVDPKCKLLRRGFQGRYQYKRLQVSQERYHEKPDKNEYSHPHDALQYVATRLFGAMVRSKKKVKSTPQPKIIVNVPKKRRR